MSFVTELFSIFEKKEKFFFISFLFLAIILAVVEMFSISLIAPLIKLMIEGQAFNNFVANKLNLIFFLNFNFIESLMIFLFFLFLIYLFKSCFAIFFTYYINKFAYNFKAKLSENILKYYLNSDYKFFIYNNSSIILRNVMEECDLFVTNALYPSFTFFTDLFMTLALIFLIFYFQPITSLLIFAFLVFFSLLFYFLVKKKTKKIGQARIDNDLNRIKNIQEFAMNIIDIKLYNLENELLNRYKISNRQAAEATKLQNILQELPRIFLEFLAIILFIIIIVFIFYFKKNQFTEALPIIGIYAAVSFKVLPSINRIMSAIQRLGFGRASLSTLNKIIKNLRDQEKLINDNKEKSNQLTFKKNIVFENIFFKYENKKDFLVENLSFNIKKNSIILINGNSGKGKTTILNLIIGLLKPSSGKILIDHFELNELNNKSWLKNIGYVAQHTNLFDDTIKNNIILSLKKEFDEKKFQKAIDYSCLDNFVKNLNHGIETHIGERGLQISGGQKQRIGIARALYRNPEILILDEATNALDKKTEDEILAKLQELKKNTTILVVKHKNINESIFDDVINL